MTYHNHNKSKLLVDKYKNNITKEDVKIAVAFVLGWIGGILTFAYVFWR